jgi:hypothetical protein
MVFKRGTKGRLLLLLLSDQTYTEDAVDCACASVAHQVFIECLCSVEYLHESWGRSVALGALAGIRGLVGWRCRFLLTQLIGNLLHVFYNKLNNI